jgi:hypothetical protein
MGLFNRRDSIVGMLLDGEHALKAYHGAVLVWDGTRSAFAVALSASAAASAPVPGVMADSAVVAPVAVADGVAPVAGVSASGVVGAVPAAGSADAPVPALSADAAVVAEAATADAQAGPAVAADSIDGSVTVPVAEGSADAVAAVAGAGYVIPVPAAAATVDVPTPAVSATGSAKTTAPTATAAADAKAPTVAGSSTVSPPTATAAAASPAAVPHVSATVTPPTATGTAQAKAPTVSTAPVASGMDKSGVQALPTRSVWAQVTSWTTRSGFATNPGTASNSLVSNGSGPVTITCQLTQGGAGTSTNVKGCRILVNGTVVQTFTGTGSAAGNAIHGGAFARTLANGDVLTMEAYHDSTTAGNREIQASGTYLFFQ